MTCPATTTTDSTNDLLVQDLLTIMSGPFIKPQSSTSPIATSMLNPTKDSTPLGLRVLIPDQMNPKGTVHRCHLPFQSSENALSTRLVIELPR
jgi:hypothetical protein